MMCGGVKGTRDVNEEITKMCEGLKEELEKKSGKKYSKYVPLKYATQVVAGTNYFVKIAVETDAGADHVHVRIFRGLPCNGDSTELHSFQEGKTLEDEVGYF